MCRFARLARSWPVRCRGRINHGHRGGAHLACHRIFRRGLTIQGEAQDRGRALLEPHVDVDEEEVVRIRHPVGVGEGSGRGRDLSEKYEVRVYPSWVSTQRGFV